MTVQTNIVQLNVSQTNPPAPNVLQQTVAAVSTGGTTTAANTSTLITEPADLTAILAGAVVISAATWSGSVVTVTTATPHGFSVGDEVTIIGMTPTAYNGTVLVASAADTTHFTYALVSNPGSATVFGSVTDEDVAELVAMITTYFANGANAAIYVLELGHGTLTANVAALATYLTDHPFRYYIYMVPRLWSASTDFQTLVGLHASNTSKVYFWVTSTLSDYTAFTAKSVFQEIEAATIPATEFTIASDLQWVANQRPSSTNKVPPMQFGFRLGVTQYPASGANKINFKNGHLNYMTSAAEGGLSNIMQALGMTCDGNPFNYWYAVDWAQINLELDISNEIINGSNNPTNPLYYNQPGINRLQNRGLGVMNRAVSYGLALGKVIATQYSAADFIIHLNNGDFAGNVVINAEPFVDYTRENPNDYAIGNYGGLSAVFTPLRGFSTIVFNLNITNFVS